MRGAGVEAWTAVGTFSGGRNLLMGRVLKMLVVTCLAVTLPAAAEIGLLAPYEFILEDFEGDAALERWRFDLHHAGAEGRCGLTLSTDWATRGRQSGRLLFRAGDGWPNAQTIREKFDKWPNFAEFEHFRVDMMNPAPHSSPDAGSNSHGIVFFTTEGPRPLSQNTWMDAHQVLHLEVDIPQQLGVRQGEPLDTSLINAFHFYAWNPARDYVRYIDNIRLTRNLGLHFTQLNATLDLLERAGLSTDVLAGLRGRVAAERERLAGLPFSAANLAEARRVFAELEAGIARHDVLVTRLTPRLLSVLGRREWNQQARDELAAVEAELSGVRETLSSLRGAAGLYEERAVQRLQSELRLLEAAVANARVLLPEASPDRGIVVGWTHASTFVKPHGQAFAGGFGEASVSGARGETVGLQVVVHALGEDTTSVWATVASGDLPPDSVKLYALGFMNLGTAPEGSAAWQMQWYPDILYPPRRAPAPGITIPAGTPQPYLLEISIPRDASPGLHHLSVRVESSDGEADMPVTLRVHDFAVPERFTLKTTCGVRFADAPILVHYGLDPGNIYGGWTGADDDFILRQYRAGQQLFNIQNQKSGWIAFSRRGWGFDPARGTEEENWERYLAPYREFLERMDRLGIPSDRFFLYGWDEVGPNPDIRAYVGRLRTLGVRVMGTPMGSAWPEEPADTFDMWAGGLGYGEARRERIAQVHQAGGQAWWYDNNLGFDPDVWIARQKGWYAKHWRMDGYLIYSASAWTARDEKHLDRTTLPYSNWQEPSRDARGAACALTYYWGDTEKDRYASLRLWNFRAGLYDYEYLRILEDVAEKLARSGMASRHQPLVRRARLLSAVPETLLMVPTIDPAAGTALELPAAMRHGPRAVSLLAARAEAAELIQAMTALLD